MYAALILDLEKSKRYSNENRNEIQQYLVKTADFLNQVFDAGILKELRFNGGDELQGLFRNPTSAFLCLRMFWRALNGIKFHAGIGIGEWTTIIEDRDTYYQDGPVYHQARNAVETAKKETDYTAVIVSKTEYDPILNAMLNSCYKLIQGASSYQNELAILLECRYPILQDYPFNLNVLAEFPGMVKSHYRKSTDPVARIRDAISTGLEEWKDSQSSPIQRLSEPIKAYTDTNHPLDDVIFRYSHPYGAAKELSDYTGLTRQAVDNALRKGDVYTERSIALAIVNQFQQIGLNERGADH